MGGGKSGNLAISQSRGSPGFQGLKPPAAHAQPVREGPQSLAGAYYRSLAPFQKGGEPCNVVGMGVGNENGGEIRRSQLQLPQSRGDPAAGYTGVQQQVGLTAGYHQRVPGGTAGQGLYSGQNKTSSPE